MNGGAVAPDIRLPRVIMTNRGTWAMAMFITTEATLFVCLFFSYYYLGHLQPAWPPEPPEWKYAIAMLAVLLTSSAVLHFGEKRLKAGAKAIARAAVGLTVLLGIVFLVIQTIEFREHLKKLKPTTNAYGSIFYTITSIHALHVVLGLCMLAFVLVLPEIGEAEKPPHRPLHNASMYWHFVDVVWVVIVALLYVAPNLKS